MKDASRQQFRLAPHTSGLTHVKPKDYEEGGFAEAPSFYGAWTSLKSSPEALQVGDLLEREGGELRIFKYVGFDEAQWVLPESKPAGAPGALPDNVAATSQPEDVVQPNAQPVLTH